MVPSSLLTSELPYFATVRGHHVFSDGRTFSIDDKLPDGELERVIDYILEEGLIHEESDWIFLT